MPTTTRRTCLIRITSCLLLLLIGCTGLNAGQISVDEAIEKQWLDAELDYLFDSEQTLHVSQLADPQQSAALDWHSGSERVNHIIMEAGLYWFKGTIRNPHPYAVEITLQTEYPSINVADLYTVDENKAINTIYAGAGINDRFNNRPSPHRNLVNSLTLPANSAVTFIWRIESEPLFQFRVTAWQPDHFVDQDQHSQILYGMLYGTLIVMALYNCFLYFSTRQKSYIYYVLYVLTATYLIAADQGHVYQYLATDEPWAKLPIYSLAYAVNMIMLAQFCIHFLNLKKHSPLLLHTLRGLAGLAALTTIIVAISNSLSLLFVGLLTTSLLYIFALVAGIIVRKAGIISAGHFIIAIMILVFSLIANNMATIGLISSSGITEHLGAIGTTLMLVFFSLALADRINQLQKENKESTLAITQANQEKLKAQTELQNSQTERIRLEQITSQARLESRSKSDFLATMSHEIRTPMNGIFEMTELIKSTQLDDKQTHYLHTIERSSQTLLAIINDLQDFAKIEAGKMELKVASFNLETLIDDCISTFSLRAVEKNLNFIADLEPGISPVLKGDVTKLQQIILNLLSNAFKFTENGNILLSISSTDKPAINSIELRFEVQDSGIGLTQDEQQRLFTPFQHADESTYGRFGGSGLGLAISKQLAELMDGNIGVHSIPGEGSLFWFTARLLIDEHPDTSLLREKSSTLAGKRLLLVDPNPVSADIIERLVKSWKLDAESCNSVSSAKDKLHEARLNKQPFNIVLAEYYLHDEDSLSLAHHLQQEEMPEAQFILMATGRSLSKQEEIADYGIEILLEKPITNALLHDALIQAITPSQQKFRQIETINPETSQLKVMLVEDNQVNQLVIQGLLKQLGITPSLAANGLQALTLYDQQDYDLILMDCEMPEMDGYEATDQIRSKEQTNGRDRTPIVALSAHARSDHQNHAHEVGMDNYLTKPITLSDLVTLIEQLMAEKNSH